MLKKYNGSSFVSTPTKKYNGSSWEYADVKAYDGSNWDIISPIRYDEDLSDGLVSYYNFEEDATDQVGSNDGTISGATYTSSGKVGGCYSFDGSNDSINFGNILSWERTDAKTFSFWAKLNAGKDQAIFTKRASTRGYELHFLSDNKFRILLANSDSNRIIADTTNAVLTDNTWQHFVITYTGSSAASGMKIYVNGQEVPLTTVANTLSATSVTTDSLYIGKAEAYSRWIDGTLDEIGIWNRELSSTEVTKLYNYSKARYFS